MELAILSKTLAIWTAIRNEISEYLFLIYVAHTPTVCELAWNSNHYNSIK